MRFPYRGSGTVLVCNGDVLLGVRSTKPFFGFWSIPGGGHEKFETDFQTAIRETREETGINLSDYKNLKCEGTWKIRLPFFRWTCFFFILDEKPKINANEFSKLEWKRLKEVKELKGKKIPFLRLWLKKASALEKQKL